MIHLQTSVPNWLEAVVKMPAKTLVKSVTVQQLAEAKAHNGGVYTMLRYVNDGMQQVNPSDTEATRENRARAWFNSFIDGTFLNGSTSDFFHWRATDIIGFWNEYMANSQTAAEKEMWWKQERTAARIWRDEYRNGPNGAKLGHIRLAISATAIGNDIPWQTAETATLYDCIVDYHAYTLIENGVRDPGDWQFLSGRWSTMDNDFRARGYTVKWLFGESGPFSSAVTGWRHESVLNGDINAYVAAIRTWIRDVKTTLAYQQGRVLGYALFTTGGGSIWEWFETKQPELNALADMLKQEWLVVTPPTPIPTAPDAYLWAESKTYAAAHGILFNPVLGLWQRIMADGYTPVHREISRTYEGKSYAIQQGWKQGQPNRLYIWTSGQPIRWTLEGQVPPPLPSIDRPLGLDVSHWQGQMDWPKAKAANVWFAFIKATQRLTVTDSRFLINWQQAKAAGILVGAYHYFQPTYDPVAQAEYFVNTVLAAGQTADLPFSLDVEEQGSTPGFSDMVKTCLNKIEELTGRKPILYTSIYYANHYLGTVTPAVADLWIANWTQNQNPNMPNGWTDWRFWQYSNSGVGSTYGAQSARIDLNRFGGNLQQLYDYAGE